MAIYLLAAARVLAGAGDVAEAARRLLAMIGEAEGWCAGVVWLSAEGTDKLRCAEVWCPPERPAPDFERACRESTVTRGAGLAGRVWVSGRSVVVTDVTRDEDVRRDPRVERESFRAVAAVPVSAGLEVMGVLELFGTAPREPDPLLGEVLASVAGQLAEFVRRTAAEQALARAQERLRTVVGNAPIILFGFDREGRFTIGEGQGLAAAGLRIDQITGRSIHEVYRDFPVVIEQARRALAGESFTATLEIDRSTVGGVLRIYETRYTPIFDAQGRVAEVIAVATDITERANAERALRRSEAQLLEADRLASLGALAAGVAHEINNPLAYVLLNIDLVIRELEARPSAGHSSHVTPALRPADPSRSLSDLAARLREARAGVDRVRLIAQDLKAFSRVDTERRTPVDVRRVLDSSIDIAANEIRHRARLVRDYREVPPVEADPSRLGQVFLNLLVNAVQAMDEASIGRNEIRVGTKLNAAGSVVVTIADTGAGIPRGLVSRIFEPFFTTKPAGVGTGLGLAICKSIITSLGGDIRVESEAGKGSTFQVILPAASAQAIAASVTPSSGRQSPVPAEPVAPPRAPPSHATATKRARVLVVDDEVVLASALGRSIEADHDVVVLPGGREALELLRRDDRFDVILCDLIMPVVTGMDLYEEIRRTKPLLAGRIVFMTGGTFTPRTREFLATVKNPTLDKPFDLTALNALLRARARARA
ncbi:Sensory box histidine kinase/response regulator [Minicystis rosea]|nr:Sensory box histidine kinase/response regulator [Minicystis rosea]